VRLQLDPPVLERLTAHLGSCLPHEGCGFLVGVGHRATRFVPAPNVSRSASRFEVEPRFLFDFFREIRASGESLVGICHSHPSGPARPSDRDIAEAHYPSAVHVIVSLAGDVPEVRAWRIFDGQVFEVEIHASC